MIRWPLTGVDMDAPTVRITRLPRPDPAARPNRDLVVRQMRRRPVRGAMAMRLTAMFAAVPAWEVAAGATDRRARWAIRTSERLLGVPDGTTRAALAERVS